MIPLPFIKLTPSLSIHNIYLSICPFRPSSVRTRRGVSVAVNGVSCARRMATRGTRLASDRTIIVGHRAKPVGRSFRNGRARALWSPPPQPANVIDNGDRFMIGHCLAARNHARAYSLYACDCVVTARTHTHTHSIIIIVAVVFSVFIII